MGLKDKVRSSSNLLLVGGKGGFGDSVLKAIISLKLLEWRVEHGLLGARN